MGKEPIIEDVERGESEVILYVNIPEDLDYFEGHFPFQAMLPGVVQVGWIMKYASQYLSVSENINSIDSLKFRRKLKPGDSCTVSIEWDSAQSIISFAISEGDERVSSGHLTVSSEE